MDFWLYDTAEDTSFDYTALSGGLGGSVVTSGTAPATLINSSLGEEGTLSFTADAFDTIVLAPSDATTWLDFDNLTLSTGAVPEPASPALLGVGLAGIWAARRRRARCLTPQARSHPSPA